MALIGPAHSMHPRHSLASAQPPLVSGENVLTRLTVDLNAQLHFAEGELVLTDHHLHARASAQGAWQSWRLSPELSLTHHDHAGVATLTLRTPTHSLGTWHLTMGQPEALQRLTDQFERQQHIRATGLTPEDEDTAHCPVCHAPLPPERDECPVCHPDKQVTPSTWVLLRLWRFARPYQGMLLAGFLLTLAGTAATLVPPYLTMPLMDEILIPFQNGQAIDTEHVLLLLSGLLASALAAWALGWARTYVLALVSERIGADLRTATFEHLLRLSLDYFGSKRTGDLMARIGSETDRINVFLSLHALDFATDVLMIAMTAAILISINPWLALVTLVPLPFIAWLIHLVRDRLRTGFEKIDRVWGEVTNVLADTIPGIRVVKAFAQEQREADRFRTANQYNLQANDKLNKTWSLFTPTVSLLTEIGLLVVWAFGIWLVSEQDITVGVLTAFIAYIGRFYGRLDSMSRIVSVTQKAAAGAKRIFDILDHVSNVPDPAQPVALAQVKGGLEMQDVSFRYGSRTVIRNLRIAFPDMDPAARERLVGAVVRKVADECNGHAGLDAAVRVARSRRHDVEPAGVGDQHPHQFAERAQPSFDLHVATSHRVLHRGLLELDRVERLLAQRQRRVGVRQRLAMVEHAVLDPKAVGLAEVRKVHVEPELLAGCLRTVEAHGEIVEQHRGRHRPDDVRTGGGDRQALRQAIAQLPCALQVDRTPRAGLGLVTQLLERVREQQLGLPVVRVREHDLLCRFGHPAILALAIVRPCP